MVKQFSGGIFVGHSQIEKQRTHARIVDIASRRLREKGLEGIGVADLMKEAGMTVGGFYKHFASRDELVAEAIDAAFEGYEQKLEAQGVTPADLPFEEMMTSYLERVTPRQSRRRLRLHRTQRRYRPQRRENQPGRNGALRAQYRADDRAYEG
jgi:AcrR family transcriptional regulator